MAHSWTSTASLVVPEGVGVARVMEMSAGLLLGAEGMRPVGSKSMSLLEDVQEEMSAVLERTV